MIKKYKFTKECEICALGMTKYSEGAELSIKEDIVIDGCVELFNINCEFAREHGRIVERLW